MAAPDMLSAGSGNAPGSLNRFLILSLSAVLLAYFFVHQLACPAELALSLAASDLVSQGQIPYIDFVDNAIPHSYYLRLPLILLSKLVSFHPTLIANLFHVFLVAASLLLIRVMLGKGRASRLLAPRLPFLSVALFVYVFVFLSEFGQAPQLLVSGTLPYLAARYLSAGGERVKPILSALAGLLQALVLFLDQSFLLFWLLTEFVIFFAGRKRFFALELKVCLLGVIAMFAGLALMPGQAVKTYFGPILHLNQLSFEFFNDSFFYVGQTPDRRDLVYFFVVAQALTLPVVSRCVLIRLLSALSALGFGYYVSSTSLFTWQALAMVGFAALGLALSLAYYMRRLALGRLFKGLLLFTAMEKFIGNNRRQEFIAAGLGIACFFVFYQQVAGQWMSLSPLGYWGQGLKSDLTIFAGDIEEACPPKETVTICGTQVRPGFPALVQVRRGGDYLLWGFPFYVFKTMRERKLPAEVADLLAYEDQFYSRLKAAWSGPRRPKAIAVEDNEAHDALWAHGINAIIESDYEPGPYLSLMNGEELAGHPAFEYVGYRKSFTLYKLKAPK